LGCLDLEEGSNILLRNVGNYLSSYQHGGAYQKNSIVISSVRRILNLKISLVSKKSC